MTATDRAPLALAVAAAATTADLRLPEAEATMTTTTVRHLREATAPAAATASGLHRPVATTTTATVAHLHPRAVAVGVPLPWTTHTLPVARTPMSRTLRLVAATAAHRPHPTPRILTDPRTATGEATSVVLHRPRLRHAVVRRLLATMRAVATSAANIGKSFEICVSKVARLALHMCL